MTKKHFIALADALRAEKPVDNTQDIIDSRDVIARIQELEDLKNDVVLYTQEIKAEIEALRAENKDEDSKTWTAEKADRLEVLRDALSDLEGNESLCLSSDYGENEHQELEVLQALAEEGEGSPDWSHGETLIRDPYFEEYAEQLADDIGAIDRTANWPLNCIDWGKAADQLKADYSSVDFDGTTYWIRS